MITVAVAFSLLVLFTHTSTLAQSASPPSVESFSAVQLGDATPVVPSLPGTRVAGLSLSDAVQVLDGLNCRDSTFKNVTFKYGGGPYRLEGCKFEGEITVLFSGAALNVMGLLQDVEKIGMQMAPSAPSPTPQPRKTPIAAPIVADLISPLISR